MQPVLLFLLVIYTAFLFAATRPVFGPKDYYDTEEVPKLYHHNMYPAGMDWDAGHHRFIVGSLGEPSLFTLHPDRAAALNTFFRDPELNSSLAVLGIKVDIPRNRVLAVVTSFRSRLQTTRTNTSSNFEALVGYDLDSGSRVLFARLDQVVSGTDQRPQASGVAVDPDGNAYVTNCVDNFIWKVTPSGNATIFTQDPTLKSATPPSPEDPATWGLTAIIYDSLTDAQDKQFLTVVHSSSGRLFSVDLKTSLVSETGQVAGPVTAATIAMDGHFVTRLIVASGTGVSRLVSPTPTRLVQSPVINQSPVIKLPGDCFPASMALRDDNLGPYVLCSHLPDLLMGKSREEFSIIHVLFRADIDLLYGVPLCLLVVLPLLYLCLLHCL